MLNSILEMISYAFITRAFIVGVLISICASLIGVSLVLRKNSMIGDGLSHVGFGAFAVATVLGVTPLWFAIPVVIILSIFILKLNDSDKIHGDARIALISTISLAFGTFIISITKGVNTDISNYLFGSILSVSNTDVIISVSLSLIIILIYTFLFNKIFAITFDERFAKSIGINTKLYNMLFAILCSIVVVLGMRLIGALLISSLVVFPTLSSMQVFKKFKSVVISSVIISTISFIVGLYLSYILETPTGSTIVIANFIVFMLFKIIAVLKK